MITVNINYILNIITLLFFIGLMEVVLNRKNILTILMSIELDRKKIQNTKSEKCNGCTSVHNLKLVGSIPASDKNEIFNRL